MRIYAFAMSVLTFISAMDAATAASSPRAVTWHRAQIVLVRQNQETVIRTIGG